MNVKRCRKCGCIYEEDVVRCPTCGAYNYHRQMFVGKKTSRFFDTMHQPVQSDDRKKNTKNFRKMIVVLISIVSLPFIVIWELQKKYSSKK